MRYDAVILGLGSFGSAAAAVLASRGKKVLGLDRFSIPNAVGSHHGHSRVFRSAYFEHPDFVPLLRHALGMWGELNRRHGGGIFFQTGALYAGPRGCATVEGAAESARLHRLDVQRLTPAEVSGRFPAFHLPPAFDALWEQDAGMIVPEAAVGAFAREALADGADLRGHEEVIDWSADSSGVRVRTRHAVHHADSLVIAAGAWSSRVVADLGLTLRVTRQAVAWYWPRRPDLFARGVFPVWAVESEDGRFHYGFPMVQNPPGLKVALHGHGNEVDPDHPDLTGKNDDQEQDQIRDVLRRFLPEADGPLLSRSACLYTNSPDGNMILDLHPGHPNVALVCGCSGHGFKFAPVVGEMLADLATAGRTHHRAAFLGLSRFTTPPPG